MTTHRPAVAQFNPSVYSGEVEYARTNSSLRNGSMYKDDVGGLYKYSFDTPTGAASILIVAYPLRPSLSGTTVYESDGRFPGMARNLETKGVLVPAADEQKETQTAMTTVTAPMPYSAGPTSSPPPSPPVGGGTGGSSGGGSGPQPSAFYEEDWFPWVLGGVILTAAAGAAIILWPGPKPADVLD